MHWALVRGVQAYRESRVASSQHLRGSAASGQGSVERLQAEERARALLRRPPENNIDAHRECVSI